MPIQSKLRKAIFLNTILVLILAGILFQGCGGGGSAGGGQTLPTKTLSWEPPASFADSTPLNPATDLDSFEIFINQSGSFSSASQPNAALAAYNPGTAQITTTFNLANLSPFISKGVTYYVSVRAVAKNGLKSDFSPSLTFSY